MHQQGAGWMKILKNVSSLETIIILMHLKFKQVIKINQNNNNWKKKLNLIEPVSATYSSISCKIKFNTITLFGNFFLFFPN